MTLCTERTHTTDIAAVYEESNDDDQEFVQNLALFLTGFLSSHLKVCGIFLL